LSTVHARFLDAKAYRALIQAALTSQDPDLRAYARLYASRCYAVSDRVKEYQAKQQASNATPALAEPAATRFGSACGELGAPEVSIDQNLARAVFTPPPAGMSADSVQAAALTQAMAVAGRDGVGDLLWEQTHSLAEEFRAGEASGAVTQNFGDLHWTLFGLALQEAVCQRLTCDLDYVLLFRCTQLKACGMATSLESARVIALREGVTDAQWQQMLLLAQQELARRLGP